MINQPVISIEKLSKIYKGSTEVVLKSISLSIEKKEIFGLLGPNGAGKTTTISILCGYMKPTEGTVFINGLSVKNNLNEIKKKIGIVPQCIALYPTLTGRENLLFFGRMYGMKGKELKGIIAENLELVGLEKSADRKVKEYSEGMKRRLNLIAGIIHNPEILFLDEPTVGVDVQSRMTILDYLKSLNQKGTTIIYTSHYMDESEKFCTRIGIIDKGEIICVGKPVELLGDKSKYENLESIFLHLTGRALRD